MSIESRKRQMSKPNPIRENRTPRWVSTHRGTRQRNHAVEAGYPKQDAPFLPVPVLI